MASVDITALSIQVTSTGVKEASRELGGLSTSAANTTRRIEALILAMQRLNTVSNTVNTVGAGAGALTNALNQLTATIGQLNTRTQQADRTQRQYNEGMREAHALARGLSGSLGMLWVTYGNLAGMAVGLAIGASLREIVTAGKDVEHILEGIRVKGQETVESMQNVRKAVYDLGQGVYGPLEVAKAFDTLVMAGLKADKAVTAMSSALNLATIGGTTVEKAAFTLVQVSTAMGYTAEGFSRVGDVIAKTAAVSMSSVESLSEAFKSASVVGKMYNISLVDTATSLAALSNLGIKGTAAGTSLKNMYKELMADSDKLKNALATIGLNPKDIQDTAGNMLPLVKQFEILDKALSQFGASEQKLLIGRMSNERGMKNYVEVLDLYRQKLSESEVAATGFKNELEQMNEEINNSYGFMAQGAAAMALTVDSQFKSVKNTLQTSLVKAFQDIQPQMSLVAQGLKQAFSSPEFQRMVQGLATSVANFTLALVENADAVWFLIKGFIALKVAIGLQSLLAGLATSLLGTKTAMDAAAVSAARLNLAMGAIAIALTAAAWAYMEWNSAQEQANNSDAKAAIAYVEDFTDKIKENTKQVEEQIRLMKLGKTATDAYVLSQQMLGLQKVKEQNQLPVGAANEERAQVYASFTSYQRKAVDAYAATGKMPAANEMAQLGAVQKYQEALAKVNAAKQLAAKLDAEAARQLELNIQRNEELAKLADEQAKARNNMPTTGNKTLPEDPNKAAINSAMMADVSYWDGEIKKAKKIAEGAREDAQSKYRQGVIGDIALNKQLRDSEVAKLVAIAEAEAEKIKILQRHENKGGEIAAAQGNIRAMQEAVENADREFANRRLEIQEQTKQETLKLEVEKFKSLKQHENAFKTEFELDHNLKMKRLGDNIDKEIDLVKKGELEKLKAQRQAAYDAGLGAAQDKDVSRTFDTIAAEVKNAIKAVTVEDGAGLGDMFDAAMQASDLYKAKLIDLKTELEKIKDPVLRGEKESEINNIGKNYQKMWATVGESISESLENAFGRGGKAAGDLISVVGKYQSLEKATNAQRIKAYGDSASAAKGFFKEGSDGYKVLEGAEKAFRMLELAGLNKSLQAHIAHAMAKATAWIPAVFMSFMGSMGPWGAAAAGVAIAGVLGYAAGGSAPVSSAERQRTQGTGSVLGDSDAKSESIANSLSIMEKNSGLGLAQGSQMVTHLRTVANSLSGLATLIVRTTGITGAVKDESYDGLAKASGKLDGAFGLLSKFAEKISNTIFGGKVSTIDTGFTMDATTVGAARNGVSASQYSETKKDGGWFRRDKYSTNLASLGEDANGQFSKIIDGMANTLNSAANLLGIGGDAFTSKLQSFVIDIGKISLKGLSSEEIKEQLQAVFSKIGDDMAKFALSDLDQFQRVGEGYLETVARVANDLIQVKDVFAILGKELTLTGISAIKVSEALIESAGSLEKLTEGTKYFVDNFLTEAERMDPITKSVKARLAELNMSELTSIELYKKKVLALDLTNAADQKLYADLLALAPAFKEAADYADKLAKTTDELTEAQKKALEIAQTKRQLEIELLEAQGYAQEALNERRKDEIEELNKLSPALGALKQEIFDAQDLSKKRAEAKSALETAYQRESSAMQTVIDKFKQFADSLKKFKESLLTGDLSNLSPEQKYLASKRRFETTARLAASGDEGALADLQSVSQEFLNLSREYNASTNAYSRDFDLVQKAITQGANAAQIEVDIASNQLQVMKQQYEALLGIKELLSFDEAAAAYGSAIGYSPNMGFTPGKVFNGPVMSIIGADGKWGNVVGNDGRVYSDKDYERIKAGTYYPKVDGSHYDGLDFVPKDNYLANLHYGERVQTAKSVRESDANSKELLEVAKKLLEKAAKTAENTDAAIAQQTAIAAEHGEMLCALKDSSDKQARKLAKLG